MKDEPPARFDRSAVMDRAIRRFTGFDVQLAKQAAKGDAGALVPDANADRAILVMDAQCDDRALKSRIGHSGHGQKQLARQETRFVNHGATMGRSGATGKT